VNPSAILTALIAPAVLISACGSLILSTSERTSKVVAQLRVWSREFAELTDAIGAWEAGRRTLVHDLIGLATRRARLLQRALMGFIVSTGLFVATGAAVAGSALLAEWEVWWGWYAWVPVFIGLAGSGVLLVACVLLASEARLGITQTSEEVRFAMSWRTVVTEESPLEPDDEVEGPLYSPRSSRTGLSEQILGAMPRPWRGGQRR
jgi:hypothetical protein